MLSFASFLLLGMAIVMAVLVTLAARVLVRRTRAVDRYFVPDGALGLRLAISVVIALAALWLFVEIADNVIDRDKLYRLDAQVLAAFAPWRTSAGFTIARGVSLFGTTPVMSLLALLLLLVLYRPYWREVAVAWALVMGGGKLVEVVLKHTFHRSRPIGALQQLNNPSYSYPSGHSMGAMIGYGLLVYLLLLRVRRPVARAAITTAAALLIIAIGTSRLVLAVHFFTDVVGGFAAGGVWLALSIAALDAARERFVPAPQAREHRRVA